MIVKLAIGCNKLSVGMPIKQFFMIFNITPFIYLLVPILYYISLQTFS